MFQTIRMLTGKSQVNKVLTRHSRGLLLTTPVIAARYFPLASRVDVQVALDNFLQRCPTRLLGIHSGFGHETVNLAHLLTRGGPFPVDIGPLQHDEVDTGEPDPVRCLQTGLWLSSAQDLPFAVLVSPAMRYGVVAGIRCGLGGRIVEQRVEITFVPGEPTEAGPSSAAGRPTRGRGRPLTEAERLRVAAEDKTLRKLQNAKNGAASDTSPLTRDMDTNKQLGINWMRTIFPYPVDSKWSHKQLFRNLSQEGVFA